MNLLLAIKPHFAEAILSGEKTAELRRIAPRLLDPGSTIFLVSRQHILGHVTLERIAHAPAECLLRSKWEASIASLAGLSPLAVHTYLDGARQPCALHLRYPVRYDSPLPGPDYVIQSFAYTTQQPHITHPRLENFLLYLHTHKTP